VVDVKYLRVVSKSIDASTAIIPSALQINDVLMQNYAAYQKLAIKTKYSKLVLNR
jgi:hypothetical protein